LGRKPSYIQKNDDEFNTLSSQRNSSTSRSNEYFEMMPDITYSQDFDSSCIINDNRGSNHYQNVYLPSFQSSDKSAHMSLGHTLPPPTIGHSDVLYGLDTMYPDYGHTNYAPTVPRVSLSSESSALFDDWTATSSISNIKLTPLNLGFSKDL
jgi:hypothetical protein